MISLMHQITAWFGWGNGVGALAAISGILTILAVLAPVAAGMFLYGLERLQLKIIGILNHRFAYFFVNYITFPGTFVHEMSHLCFAVITGAEVCEISMFESDNGRLGHIAYRNRGPWFMKSIQDTLTSVAPTIVGLAIGYLLIRHLLTAHTSIGISILLWYLVISLINHSTMSDVDLKGYFSGVWVFILPLFLLFFVSGLLA